MLRFLIDLRGEEVDNKQMRDDLITLLIAGHETTAAVLTWMTYALSQHPAALRTVQAEIDAVIGDRYATFEDIENMPELQKVLAETLRMWPAPPLFIRCALEEDTWPEGGTGIEGGSKLARANDLFISTYNMGRSPQLW
jgi:cytochrome P450